MQHWNRKKYRMRIAQQVGTMIVVVASVSVVAGKSRSNELGKAPRLQTVSSMRINGTELSGLSSIKKSVGGEFKVAAVGDGLPQIVDVAVSEDLKVNGSETIDFTEAVDERFALCHSELGARCQESLKMVRAQWEAFAIDASGRNFLLQESSHAVIVMNSTLTSVQHVVNFDFSQGKFKPVRDSKKHRRIDDDLSAEGFVLLKNGHILVAKEKNPAVLGEFGPRGSVALGINKDTILGPDEVFDLDRNTDRSSLVLLAEWQIAGQGKCDIADLATDSAGFVYVLSENCKSIKKIDRLVPGDSVAVAIDQWRLPKGVHNPEGFSIDDLNRFWVVSDTKRQGDNLFIVAP